MALVCDTWNVCSFISAYIAAIYDWWYDGVLQDLASIVAVCAQTCIIYPVGVHLKLCHQLCANGTTACVGSNELTRALGYTDASGCMGQSLS